MTRRTSTAHAPSDRSWSTLVRRLDLVAVAFAAIDCVLIVAVNRIPAETIVHLITR